MNVNKAVSKIGIIADKIEHWEIDDLAPYARNAKKHPPEQVAQIAASMREFGFTIPVLVAEDGTIVAGHGRVLAAKEIGLESVPVIVARGWSDEQRRAYTLADNKLSENAEWDEELLKIELGDLTASGFAVELIGFDAKEMDKLLAVGLGDDGDEDEGGKAGSLAERFGVVPFSVLNAREGWWQDRKRAWLALGIRSEVGRGENLLRFSDTINEPDPSKRKAKSKEGNLTFVKGDRDPETLDPVSAQILEVGNTGTSIFDPVLCELAYRWFSPQGGVILDPFAGGSVRGVVAAKLGREYVGVDLRPEQVEANRVQAEEICGDIQPEWHEGDSLAVIPTLDVEADMIFSCPPYADLEVYSDDPRDLSTMDYAEFCEAYAGIIKAAAAKLKDDRFACFVIGEVRDKKGNYYGFVPDTIRAFEEAGLRFYNEAILVIAAGSLPIRAGKQFEATRKLGKTHQNVLVFVKGDAKRATEAIGAVEFGDFEQPEEAEEEADADDSQWGEKL